MAQKLILCDAAQNVDILASSPAIAECLADGFVASSVSGFASRDNRIMCFVLLTKTEAETTTETPTETTPTEETPAASETPAEGGEGGAKVEKVN